MSGKDDETLRFYEREAATYAARERFPLSERLDAFLAGLPVSARILELGCGGGQDAFYMLARGFDVTPTDGSAQMAAEAERLLQRPVRVMRFAELDDTETFDGVWASASLLHVPRDDLSGILALVHQALRPDGRFWASFKAGREAGRDALGRFYNYLDEAGLRRRYEAAGSWSRLAISGVSGGGYDGQPTEWLWVEAER
jgi:SAM-dependent methyltransferase